MIRRILVALNTATSRDNLDLVADLAARLKAEVTALFVEDEELLQIADFPHVRQVFLPTGRAEDVSREVIEQQLRALANETRRALARASERRRVRWSFEVVRGSLVREVVSAASGADLVIVERVSRSFMGHGTLASGLSAAVDHLSRSVLLLHGGERARGPVVAVLTQRESAQRVLEAAAQFARSEETDLVVVLAVDSPAERAAVRSYARDWLDEHHLPCAFQRLSRHTAEHLGRALLTLRAGMLVLPADAPSDLRIPRSDLLEHVPVPIFLVR